VSVVIVMSRPTDWARAIGVVARVTSMGAAATGFAIGMRTLHYAAPSLDAASISHDRFATDLCTDNPADPTCPPQGPADVKCATATWLATAFCAGGPFAPNIVTPPPLLPGCSPAVAGCPGYVPPIPPPPDAPSSPPTKGHEPPPHEPPPHEPPPHEPPPPSAPAPPATQPDPLGPPPVVDHPAPGGSDVPPPSENHSQPGAPAAPPPVVEAPPAPVAPAPVEAPAPAPSTTK
jgi:hypothetical protein